jgi:hypothetical protein
LSFAAKHIPDFRKYCVPYDLVAKKVGEEIRRPDDDDPEIERHTELSSKSLREIADGEWHTKLMVGNPSAPGIVI